MKSRPISVVVISIIMTGAGVFGLVHQMKEILLHPLPKDMLWVIAIQLVAIVCGIALFLGHNWARWLTVLWLGFHVAISFHPLGQFVFHAALFAMIAYILFRRPEADYFKA